MAHGETTTAAISASGAKFSPRKSQSCTRLGLSSDFGLRTLDLGLVRARMKNIATATSASHGRYVGRQSTASAIAPPASPAFHGRRSRAKRLRQYKQTTV